MVLVKLNDGVDTPALVTALTTKPERVRELLTYVGGTTDLPRGGAWRATTTLRRGQLRDARRRHLARSGRLNFTRPGEVQGFTVSGKPGRHRGREADRRGLALRLRHQHAARSSPRRAGSGSRTPATTTISWSSCASAAHARPSGSARVQDRASRRARAYHPAEVLAPTSAATAVDRGLPPAKGTYIAYCSYREQPQRRAPARLARAWSRRSRCSKPLRPTRRRRASRPGSSTPPSGAHERLEALVQRVAEARVVGRREAASMDAPDRRQVDERLEDRVRDG